MADDPAEDSSGVLGENSERVLPAHGSAERSRVHHEQLVGSHGSQADDQSMRRFDPLGSFRWSGDDSREHRHQDSSEDQDTPENQDRPEGGADPKAETGDAEQRANAREAEDRS
jgi:hypothetical protein